MQRKKKIREPKNIIKGNKFYNRVLIVCEGEETEPAYFRAIQRKIRLPNTNIIKIISSYPQREPMDIADCTSKEIEKANSVLKPYNYVFCVFDGDIKNRFEEACKKIMDVCKDMKNKDDVLARSWPCFEYWILLHFEYKRPVFPKESPCIDCTDKLEKRIKKEKHLPKYKKNYNGFEILIDRLETAIQNSKKSCHEASNDITGNPTATEVYKVLEWLQKLKADNRLPSA